MDGGHLNYKLEAPQDLRFVSLGSMKILVLVRFLEFLTSDFNGSF